MSGMLLRLRMLAQAAPATRKQQSALIVIPRVNSLLPFAPLTDLSSVSVKTEQ
jgi:hypothetical protein